MDNRADNSLLSALWRGALNLVFPAHCVLCRTALEPECPFLLCGECRDSLPLIEQPYCPRCGRPIHSPTRVPFDMPCGECRLERRRFDRCRSAGTYGGALKECIHLFKYRDMPELARPLGRLMAERGAELFGGVDHEALVPVPLHPSKRRARGYNQAQLLAREIGARAGIPVIRGAIARTEERKAQSTLKGTERKANVRGAFAAGEMKDLAGARLLLIDDVFTTGATANECCRLLLSAGARSVDVYTAARAVRE